jgi:hypothetical protein
MSPKTCKDCGNPVSGRRRRCPGCRRIFRAERERERYHADRNQDAGAYEHLDGDDEVVDYTTRSAKPPTPHDPPRPYRAHWTHDNATRVRRLAEQEWAADDEPDQTTWDRMTGRLADRLNDRRVFFPAPRTDSSIDPRGRSAPWNRGVYSHEERGGQLIPPGIIVRSGPDLAVEAQRAASPRGALPGGPRVYAGHLSAPPPNMIRAEQQVAEG